MRPKLVAWFQLLLVLLCLMTGRAWAQDTQPIPVLSDRVIDQTQTLGAEQRQALIQQLAAVEARLGSQVVVLMLPSTQPEDIAAYAQRVADAWKIGRRDVGDGLLIVVAKNDRKVRIEVAKTLEGAIPDLAAKRIINEQIKPAFKAGNYALGLQSAVDRLGRLIEGEALPPPKPGESGQAKGRAPFDFGQLAMFLFIATPIIGAALTGLFGRKLGSLLTGGAVGAIGWMSTTSLLLALGVGGMALFLVGVMGLGSSSGLGRGLGGPVIWGGGSSGGWGGGSSGGGFGSGGGGDFGGGGASGDW